MTQLAKTRARTPARHRLTDFDEAPASLRDPRIVPFSLGVSCGVYFLSKDGVVVYVGQSRNLPGRIGTHFVEGTKTFDAVHVLPCNEHDLNAIESWHIHRLRPKFNFSSSDGTLIAPRADTWTRSAPAVSAKRSPAATPEHAKEKAQRAKRDQRALEELAIAGAGRDPNALLRLPAVEAIVGLRKSSLYKMMRSGQFPEAVSITRRCVAWRYAEVIAWKESLATRGPLGIDRAPVLAFAQADAAQMRADALTEPDGRAVVNG